MAEGCSVKIGISFGVDNVGWHQNWNHSRGWGTRQEVKCEIGIITTFLDVDKWENRKGEAQWIILTDLVQSEVILLHILLYSFPLWEGGNRQTDKLTEEDRTYLEYALP